MYLLWIEISWQMTNSKKVGKTGVLLYLLGVLLPSAKSLEGIVSIAFFMFPFGIKIKWTKKYFPF